MVESESLINLSDNKLKYSEELTALGGPVTNRYPCWYPDCLDAYQAEIMGVTGHGTGTPSRTIFANHVIC